MLIQTGGSSTNYRELVSLKTNTQLAPEMMPESHPGCKYSRGRGLNTARPAKGRI